MRRLSTLALALLLGTGAAPQTLFVTALPMPNFAPAPKPAPSTPSGFTVAPTPNQDASAPLPPKASKDASLTPGVFTRRDQFHGSGYAPASTVQVEQERRAKPGAGINLSMPLQ